MKQRFTIVALFFSILNATDTFGQEQIGQKAIKSGIWNGKIVKYVDREVAVKARRGVSISEFQAVLSEFKGTLKQDFNLLRWAWIDLPEGGYTLSIIDQLKKLPVVETAEPNFIGKTDLEPNDPYFKGTSPATYTHQWSLKNTGQVPPSGTIDADIDGPEAWSITTGNQDVIIAVLDSGIPMENGTVSHPDLDDPAKIILGPDYIDEPGSPEYQEGVRDRFGHGTHVAGIAGAETMEKG